MTGLIIRIGLRYGAGFLVARGLLGADDAAGFSTDPDIAAAIEAGAGVAVGAVVEGWHYLARRFGWEH
ncbi:hypothetical protein OOJ09_12895 [Mesorhizobium qingshengii]|uniref:Uncharacterized protein n=1 Tax=Mesorhizobium qingshengii TaxID=1165689 RepID=A0ABT4QU30_9HYPH|nr:hypothetical protein [Mesorhizobium qingshengii]MCZ8545084.1 hypothetical protein [Mesorhizobium qingshengii]